jgi:hypothetical protein
MNLLGGLRRLNTLGIGFSSVNARGKPFAIFSAKETIFSMTSEFEILVR